VDDQRSSRARLDSELAIIAQMGLAGYVLTVAPLAVADLDLAVDLVVGH